MRRAAGIFVVVALLGLGWFAASGFREAEVWTENSSMLPLPDAENGYFAYLGLAAPEGVTPQEFGLAYAKTFAAWRNRHPLDAEFWYAALGPANADQPRVSDAPEASGVLFYEVVPAAALDCWLAPAAEYAGRQGGKAACASPVELDAAIEKNHRLLDNMARMLAFRHFAVPPDSLFYRTSVPSVPLARLYAASLQRRAQKGEVEVTLHNALEAFEGQQAFRRSPSGEAALVMASIPFASVLRRIVYEHPEFAPVVADKLLAAVNVDKDELLKQSLVATDISLIKPLSATPGTFGQFRAHATTASILHCVGELSHDPDSYLAPALPEECRAPATGMFNSLGARAVRFADTPLLAIWSSAKPLEARLTAQALAVKALAERTRPEDMAAYLAKAPQTNPLTRKPYEWDAAQNAIITGARTTAGPQLEPISYPQF